MADETENTETTVTEAPESPRMDHKKWREFISAAESRRKDLVADWKENVAFRVMRPFSRISAADTQTPGDRVAVPEDWSRSKQKAAQLAYQIPRVVATAKRPEFETAAPIVTAAINDKLSRECRASYMIDECLSDVINASGLMVSIVGVDVRTEMQEHEVPGEPVIDPMTGLAALDPVTGQPVLGPPTTQTVEHQVSKRFYWDRISTASFLWPREFSRSDWDKAPWLGYDFYLPLEEARRKYNLGPDFKSASKKPMLLADAVLSGQEHSNPEDYVKVTQLFYYGSFYDPDIIHPDCIKTIVFVEGKEEPVVDEKVDWQMWVDPVAPVPAGPPTPEQPQGTPAQPGIPGHYVGITKLPIRVGTLVYVSDLATPPSDSMVGRAQVREMSRSRSQMLRQRDHSIPIRWYDVNRIDPMVVEAIKAGTWQDIIPMDGPGDHAIGEVARANYPRENFQFSNIIGADLDRAWSLSNNQLGTTTDTERSATEVNVMSSANNTRLDYEKGRVNRYLVEGAQVLFQLMQRFMDETDYVRIVGKDGAERLVPVNQDTLAGEYAFDIKADSSERVDLTTRQANIVKVYNLLANSPSVNRSALEREIIELHGLDPKKIEAEPKEPAPDKPNVSYRFGGEDLLNPLAVAILQKSGVNITPDEIKAAALMVKDAIAQMREAQLPPPAPPTGGGPPPGVVPPGQQPPAVEPPETNDPILKRGESGTRLAA